MGGQMGWWPEQLSVPLLQKSGSIHKGYFKRQKSRHLNQIKYQLTGKSLRCSFLTAQINKKRSQFIFNLVNILQRKSESICVCVCILNQHLGLANQCRFICFLVYGSAPDLFFKHRATEGLLFLEFVLLLNPLICLGKMSRMSTQHTRKSQ